MTDLLIIKLGETERELFMTYGLLNALARATGGIEKLPAINLDDDLRDSILKTVLAERSPTGKVTKPVDDLDDLPLTVETVETLTGWVAEHLTGFFVRSLARAKEAMEAQKATLEKLDLLSENG